MGLPARPEANAPAIDGIVIIFDSADGGMISGTLIDVQLFSTGALSADDLWKRCNLDPPETFKLLR
jgi:hypothetical protein